VEYRPLIGSNAFSVLVRRKATIQSINHNGWRKYQKLMEKLAVLNPG
jgi:hypothetical protein